VVQSRMWTRMLHPFSPESDNLSNRPARTSVAQSFLCQPKTRLEAFCQCRPTGLRRGAFRRKKSCAEILTRGFARLIERCDAEHNYEPITR